MAEPTIVNIPGVGRVRFPDTMSQAEINLEAGRLYDEAIDRRSGAPAGARMAAGTARTDDDRLATVRKSFPDAQPYGEGNFVYSDPKTGRPTLFNEVNPRLFGIPLPTVGDIAGAAPEITEAAGSAVGAGLGGIGGALVGAPAGPVGMVGAGGAGAVAGAGLGGGMTRSFWDLLAQRNLGTVDSRSPGQVLKDQALDIGMNASGQAVGQALPGMLSSVVRPVTQRIAGMVTRGDEISAAARRQGIEPPLGVATNNPTVQRIEATASPSPIGGPVQDAYQRLGAQFARRGSEVVDDVAGQGGQVIYEKGPLGGFIQQAAQNAGERFGQRIGQLDAALDQAIGPTTRVDAPSVRALIAEYEQRIAADPNTMGPILNGPLARLRRVAADVDANGGVQFSTLRTERTSLGQDLARPDVSGYTGSGGEFWQRAYGALAQDIGAAANAAGPDAARAAQTIDRYVRLNRSTGNIDFLTKLADAGWDTQAANFALSGTKDGVANIARMRRNFTREEWDTIAASTLQQMGAPKQGATALGGPALDFDMMTFAKNWSSMSNAAKSAMFGGSRYADSVQNMNDLFRIAQGAQTASGKMNFSNTTNNAVWGILGLGALENAASAATGVDTNNAITMNTAAALVSGRTMLKLMESPAFVRWATGAARAAQNDPNGLGPWVGRLGQIYADEKEIRPQLNEYYNALTPRLQALGVKIEQPAPRR